ncbi:ABC transporter ATP-binding protein [Piscinibacterium candidicorallinum]|uniref:ABC transporter ATP-binding protein n=1 Tax=Piscinibacterium candidicorallinum TaxID=1793872 RepID=A0ABV7H612_9BURK
MLPILQDVDLAVHRGETAALVGASGSGKSTLLALLAGLDQPSSGEVLLLNRSLGSLDEDARARLRRGRVGFVFQTFQLLPHLSALENVAMPLEIGEGLSSAQARERATQMLGRVGLAERLSHTPRTLSGGEQQRVALARAFVTQPEIVFADEPTGSLDAATGERVMDLMFALNTEQQATLILVTHDSRLAARCKRRFRIDAGRVGEIS